MSTPDFDTVIVNEHHTPEEQKDHSADETFLVDAEHTSIYRKAASSVITGLIGNFFRYIYFFDTSWLPGLVGYEISNKNPRREGEDQFNYVKRLQLETTLENIDDAIKALGIEKSKHTIEQTFVAKDTDSHRPDVPISFFSSNNASTSESQTVSSRPDSMCP